MASGHRAFRCEALAGHVHCGKVFATLRAMRNACVVMLSLCASALLRGAAEERGNDWRPMYTIMEPVCQITDWNQTGPLNTYVEVGKGYVCGCDPLAWGQILTYHALNNGYPARGWEPEPYTGEVHLGPETVFRTTMEGPYDWVAIRDKTTWTDEAGETVSPVGRLMWDLGTMGGTQYGADLGTAGTIWPRFARDYFHYAGVGYAYDTPRVNAVMQAYWPEMLRRILRTSLQVGAPLGTGIAAHMIVTDGWGVDADGTEWFHVDYGWGSASGKWWNLDKFVEMAMIVHPLVHPNDLGAVVVGRVADAAGEGIAGAEVSLYDGSGAFLRKVTTDLFGCYRFTSLPRVDVSRLDDPSALSTETYAVTVAAAGYLSARQEVALEGFIDRDLRIEKHNAWEEAHGKDNPVFYPHAYGGAVADVTLERDSGIAPATEVLFVAPDGVGDGTSWAAAAPLTQETLNATEARGVREVRVAQGEYRFSSELKIPKALTVRGGYHPASGLCDPLAAPTVLRWEASQIMPTNYVELGAEAVLEGCRLSGETTWANSVVRGAGANAVVRGCILSGSPIKAAEGVRLETSIVLNAGMQLEDVEVFHCTFVGDLPKDKGGADLGGNRLNAATDALRPRVAMPCAGDHVCPTAGLDGRPLCGNVGALAPDLFGLPSANSYRLRLR